MKVYARNCQVREIEPDLAREFIEFHHRQGMPKRCSNFRSYGLFREDELLGVIAFCSPRTRHKVLSYQYELLRCCFKDDVRVPGGVSKLIAHFVREVRPASFFTYQDTSGEKTDVYAKAGLTLVEKERPKKVLVKDGLSFASASNNRRDWFSMEQVVRYGPDRLLGTSLGEVLEDGRRLTNVELFERNGYHLETVPGDRVYEWQNTDLRFYVYRTTATDSDKYYLGRKTSTLSTVEEMMSDGYFGSGGVKFQNWKKRHRENLVKEILRVYETWGESVQGEIELIGDLHRTDPNCLNSHPGGISISGAFANKDLELRECSEHGLVRHSGSMCCSCIVESAFVQNECDVHGSTIFRGDVCCLCLSKKLNSVESCDIHGLTPHQGGRCSKCRYSDKGCPVHGRTLHTRNGVCLRCSNKKAEVTQRLCPVHGESTFAAGTCLSCASSKTFDIGRCLVHGECKVRNGNCVACLNSKKLAFEKTSCVDHGDDNLFVNSRCVRCMFEKDRDLELVLGSKMSPVTGASKDRFVCPRCSSKFVNTVNGILESFLNFSETDFDKIWVQSLCKNCQRPG